MSTLAEEVEKTSRDTSNTVWGIAAVVMLASIASAGWLFHELGEHFAIGCVIAAAVDAALCAWLRASNRLKVFGLKSIPGMALECVAAAMALVINVGAAFGPIIPEGSTAARGLLALIHGFGPVIMVLVSIAGGDSYRQLRKAKEQEEARLAKKCQADAEEAKRDSDQLAEARRDLNTIRGVRAAERDERSELEKERRTARQKELDTAAEHRQKLHDEAVADVERLQQELRQVELEAATRSQQGLQQERDKVAELQQELDAAMAAAEATKEATAEALAAAEQNRERTAQLRSEADADLAAADDARREAERIRSRLRRRNNTTAGATVSRPVSQPSSQRSATASQPPSQTATRTERIDWAVEQLRAGEELRPCDIDNKFGPPRNGSAVLKTATERFRAEMDGEWRVISSSAGGQ